MPPLRIIPPSDDPRQSGVAPVDVAPDQVARLEELNDRLRRDLGWQAKVTAALQERERALRESLEQAQLAGEERERALRESLEQAQLAGEDRVRAAEAGRAAADARAAELGENVEQVRDDLRNYRAMATQAETERRRLEAEVASRDWTIERQRNASDDADRRASRLEQELAERKRAVDDRQQELAALVRARDRLEHVVATQAETAARFQEDGRRREVELRDAIRERDEEAGRARAEGERLGTEVAYLENRIRVLEQENVSLASERDDLAGAVTDLTAEGGRLIAEGARLTAQVRLLGPRAAAATRENATLRARLRNRAEELSAAVREHAAVTAELDSVRLAAEDAERGLQARIAATEAEAAQTVARWRARLAAGAREIGEARRRRDAAIAETESVRLAGEARARELGEQVAAIAARESGLSERMAVLESDLEISRSRLAWRAEQLAVVHASRHYRIAQRLWRMRRAVLAPFSRR